MLQNYIYLVTSCTKNEYCKLYPNEIPCKSTIKILIDGREQKNVVQIEQFHKTLRTLILHYLMT